MEFKPGFLKEAAPLGPGQLVGWGAGLGATLGGLAGYATSQDGGYSLGFDNGGVALKSGNNVVSNTLKGALGGGLLGAGAGQGLNVYKNVQRSGGVGKYFDDLLGVTSKPAVKPTGPASGAAPAASGAAPAASGAAPAGAAPAGAGAATAPAATSTPTNLPKKKKTKAVNNNANSAGNTVNAPNLTSNSASTAASTSAANSNTIMDQLGELESKIPAGLLPKDAYSNMPLLKQTLSKLVMTHPDAEVRMAANRFSSALAEAQDAGLVKFSAYRRALVKLINIANALS